jgi:hypothetical protein
MKAGIMTGLVLPLVLLTSCLTLSEPALERPRGFAVFQGKESYRAISPEGVVLEVRMLENEPSQDLAFWTEALETHLTNAGYRRIGKESFSSPAGQGVVFEWLAPVGGEDWAYMTAFTVGPDRIALFEAAGPVPDYRRHRSSLLESVATLTFPQP